MSESNSDHSANPTPGEPAGPASVLPHVESPSMAPDDRAGIPEETLESEISIPVPARSQPHLTATRSTALVLMRAHTHAKEAAAEPGPEPVGRAGKSARFTFTPAAATVVAVLLGTAIGSGATAGLLYLNATPAATPADPTTFTAALGRIDRELANLKSSIDGSAKQANSQIAKIADRMDRAEKSQAEVAAKLARTTESLDRLDRRLAANGAAGAAGEITGSTPSGSLAQGPGDRQAALADPRRAGAPAPTAVLDGWVLRDVFNGGAMIQSPRNGVLEVFPGDTLPGLGRIEAIKRQDGRWVVATSRGLIVPR
jgi:hypothetical protein